MSEIWTHFKPEKASISCNYCSKTFIKATKTRWNSVMQSLSSLLKHQQNLSKYVEQFPTCASIRLINKLSAFDFEQISKIISILEPFDVCTKMASAKSATVSCYQYFINVLTKHLSRFECDLANQINLELEKRTTDVLHIEEIEFSTFLDPRFCNKTFVYSEERWRLIKAKLSHHLIMSSEQKEMEFVSPSYDMGTSSKTPENELWPEDDAGPSETEFEPSQSPLERAIGEQLQKYCNFVKSDKLGFPKPDEEPNQSHSSVFLWWRKNFSHFPDVAREAQRLLPISVSSVASERCFSKASLLFRNTLRSSLEKNLAAGIIQIQTTLAEEMLKKCSQISEESSDEDDEF